MGEGKCNKWGFIRAVRVSVWLFSEREDTKSRRVNSADRDWRIAHRFVQVNLLHRGQISLGKVHRRDWWKNGFCIVQFNIDSNKIQKRVLGYIQKKKNLECSKNSLDKRSPVELKSLIFSRKCINLTINVNTFYSLRRGNVN